MNVKHALLAGIMSAGLTCMAPLALANETQPPATIDTDVEAALVVSEDHNKQMDDLNREKELLELQGSLVRLKLDKEKTEVDLKKLKGQSVPAAISEAPAVTATPGMPDFAPVVQPADLQGFLTPTQQPEGQPQQRRPSTPSSPLDRVYVTRIYGVGGVSNVTVYFDNGIFTGAAGDDVAEGLKIVKVTDNGAVFSYKGKTRSVNITAQGLAYSRSQAAKRAELSANAQSGRSGNSGGIPNMASEIGQKTNIPPPHPR